MQLVKQWCVAHCLKISLSRESPVDTVKVMTKSAGSYCLPLMTFFVVTAARPNPFAWVCNCVTATLKGMNE